MKVELYSRKCIRCGEEIKQCMGSVLARDIASGRVPAREHCGKCTAWLVMQPEELTDTYFKALDSPAELAEIGFLSILK